MTITPSQITIDGKPYTLATAVDEATGVIKLDATPVAAPAPAPAPVPPAPAPMGKPTQATTGIPSSVILQNAPANFVPVAGKVYSGLRFTGQQTFALAKGQTCTFINCLFDANGNSKAIYTPKNAGTIIFRFCEIRNAHDELVNGNGYQVIDGYLHDSGADAFRTGNDCLIQGNYITNLGNNVGAHADGVQMLSSQRVKIIGNFFDQMHDKSCNRNIMAQYAGSSDIEISGNFFSGHGDFAIQFYDSTAPQTISIKSNVFMPNTATTNKYIPKHVQAGVVWSGNTKPDGTAC